MNFMCGTTAGEQVGGCVTTVTTVDTTIGGKRRRANFWIKSPSLRRVYTVYALPLTIYNIGTLYIYNIVILKPLILINSPGCTLSDLLCSRYITSTYHPYDIYTKYNILYYVYYNLTIFPIHNNNNIKYHCVRKSCGVKNILLSIGSRYLHYTIIKFLVWAPICYVQSSVIKEKKYERSLTLPNPGHRYYILYLFIIYIHRYIKYARALARHRRRREDFSADIGVK